MRTVFAILATCVLCVASAVAYPFVVQAQSCPKSSSTSMALGTGFLQACFNSQTGAGSYFHKGQTNQTLGSSTSVMVNVTSFDVTNSGICPGSYRSTGNLYGYRNVYGSTSAFSAVACSGATFHTYHGNGTHQAGSTSHTSTQ
jgi:hypothetical protein